MPFKDKYIITDIETNGLLNETSKFWCGWCYDTEYDEYKGFKLDLEGYVNYLEQAVEDGYKLVFHNGIKFDIPALKKLMGRDFKFDPWDKVVDTLVLARLIYSNISDIDVGLIKAGKLPMKFRGRHSLKAWGYRLGEMKGAYGEQEEAWDKFTEEMYEYNKQDVVVTLKLFEKLMVWDYPQKAIDLEHRIQWVMSKQERNGFVFDKEGAVDLYATLSAKRQELYDKLVETIKPWKEMKGTKVYKRDNAKKGIVAGKGYPIIKEVSFNPNSRPHIAKVLMKRGWKPSEFTPSGAVKVDEETLKSAMTIPETALILEYMLVQKRIGQVAEGDNAWLKMMEDDPDGYTRIHGSVNPNGAVTGRASHNHPNIAQVPAGHSPYGKECRKLFKVPEGWLQVGVDACGLELRCLGSFMFPYDDGLYCHTILNGDIHTMNQHNAGLEHRDDAKTFIYGFLYGAGDAKIGEIVGGTAKEGKALKEKFLKATPALKKLRQAVEKSLVLSSEWVGGTQKVRWRKRKHPTCHLDLTHCIMGLDGRPVYVRSPHSALNTVLQSAGALICKKWVTLVEENMRKAGYKHGWDGDFAMMAWVHDEVQVACRTREIAEDCVRIAQESMRQTQEFFNFKCQLDTEGKIGDNWYDCH